MEVTDFTPGRDVIWINAANCAIRAKVIGVYEEDGILRVELEYQRENGTSCRACPPFNLVGIERTR